jgi:alpha-tubulin suppressor-like RCC1 family protein
MLTRIESGQLASSNTKRPCLVATTGNINITSAPTTIDGVSVGVDDRVLVWQQSNASQNAIYVITTITGSTTWVRAEDFSVSSDIYGGITTIVISGDTYAKQTFTLEQPSGDPVVIGTTQLFFKPNTNSFIAGTNITKGYAVRLKDDGNIIALDTISGDTYPVIGIAQQSGTTGNTISVAVQNTISKVHTGLTPGFDYYATIDGSLSLNGDNYVGIALSSTDINVAFSSPSGTFVPSLSVIDNTIANSDGILTPGRYIVPTSGTTNLFVGEENKYADFDGTDFTFTTPINNDKASIAVGANAGNVYIYASATTTWNLSAQVTTLPTSNWVLGGTYKQNDLVIYQNGLFQANSNIPANTAFALGTAGATWKLIQQSAYRAPTKIVTRGMSVGMLIADGKVYTFNGNQGLVNYTRGVFPISNNLGSGFLNMREVFFNETTATLVDAGSQGSQAYALFSNGNLYMWGENFNGQLGIGNTTNQPYPILSTTNVSKVYSTPIMDAGNFGYGHWFILKNDGKVYGCGYNAYGQLGLGNTTNRTSWTEITGAGTNPLGVWALGQNFASTIIQKSDGTIFVCGYNGYGSLGLGSTSSAISTLTNTGTRWNGGDTTMRIIDVAFGGGYQDNDSLNQLTMFLDNGTTSIIRSAGMNNWGSNGNGLVVGNNTTTPVAPTGFSGRVSKIARAGGAPGSIYVLKTDGTLWTWGYNVNGQLDRGNTTSSGTPTQVETNVIDILLPFHTWFTNNYIGASPVIRKSDGYYRCGNNDYGQLGDGTSTQRTNFSKMRFPGNFVMKLIGAYGTSGNGQTFIATDSSDKLWIWGYNTDASIESVAATYFSPIQMTPSCLIK